MTNIEFDYLWEKFYTAVNTLATGSGSIQSRLIDAYIPNLIVLEAHEIPDDIRDKFIALKQALTGTKPTANEESVNASVKLMNDNDASQLASDILDMYEYLIERRPPKTYS